MANTSFSLLLLQIPQLQLVPPSGASWFPPLLTRRDVLLMKMKGLLIFSLPARALGRLLSSVPLSFHRVSLLSDTAVSIFPRRSHCRARKTPVHPPLCLPSLCSPSLLLIARGGNITFRIPDRPALRGMRQRALREINSDWYHACLGKPSQNLQKRSGGEGKEGKKANKEGNKNSEQRRSDSKTEVITAKIAVGFDVGFH